MSEYENSYWNNRTACSTLEDQRTFLKALKDTATIHGDGYVISPRGLAMLICITEELQYAFNRMESAIGDLKQMQAMQVERTKLKDEIKALRKERKKLAPKSPPKPQEGL